MGWSPSDFWDSTFFDFSNCYDGYCRANAIGKYKKPEYQVGAAWNRSDVAKAKAALERQRKEDPDGQIDKKDKARWRAAKALKKQRRGKPRRDKQASI